MTLSKLARRFLMPSFVVTLIYMFRHRCRVSPRAEVDLSPNLRIGKGTDISSFVKIKANGPLSIGSHVSIGTSCFISAELGGVEIGDYCMLGPNSAVIGNNYRYNRIDVPTCLQEKTSKGIRIGRNVWIGAGAIVLDGANIGDGAIVTPNSVVSGSLPENVIAQGNPAKVVFTRR